MQEKVCRQGLGGGTEIALSRDAYNIVLNHCPNSGPLLLEALNLVSAMAYFPSTPDVQSLFLSAIVACVMEARTT